MEQEKLTIKEQFSRIGRDFQTMKWHGLLAALMLITQLSKFYAFETRWESTVSAINLTSYILLTFVYLVVGIKQSVGGVWNRQASVILGLCVLAGVLIVPICEGIAWWVVLIGWGNILIGLLVSGIVGASVLLYLAIQGKI